MWIINVRLWWEKSVEEWNIRRNVVHYWTAYTSVKNRAKSCHFYINGLPTSRDYFRSTSEAEFICILMSLFLVVALYGTVIKPLCRGCNWALPLMNFGLLALKILENLWCKMLCVGGFLNLIIFSYCFFVMNTLQESNNIETIIIIIIVESHIHLSQSFRGCSSFQMLSNARSWLCVSIERYIA